MKKGKEKYLREKKNNLAAGKSNNDTHTSRNRDIKCFYCMGFGHIASQYPNKRVMVMKVNDEVDIDGKDGEKRMPPLKDVDDVCVEYLVDEHLW